MNEKLEKQIDKVSYSRNFWFTKNSSSIAIAIAINADSNRRIKKIDDFEENFEIFSCMKFFQSCNVQFVTESYRDRTETYR